MQRLEAELGSRFRITADDFITHGLRGEGRPAPRRGDYLLNEQLA